MQNNIEKEKLETLNRLYKKVGTFQETLAEVEKEAAATFNITEGYQNPFDRKYEAERLVHEIRDRLIGFTISQMNQANFTIDSSKVKKYLEDTIGKDSFDALVLTEHIESEYMSRADYLSMEEIKKQASRLMPYIWEYSERRKPTVSDILKGDKLVLRCYLAWSYGKPSMYDFLSEASALEKLIYIVLLDKKPSEVRASQISAAYLNAQTPEEVLEKKEFHSVIKSTKVYKNGKLEVQLESEEDARKVAEALVEAKP